MAYRAQSGEKLFAAANSVIYDVSTEAAAAPVVTGMNSARWQYVNFTPGLGTTVLQCVNGIDSLQMFNGTTWSVPVITDLPFSLTTSSITNIHVAKRRLWYVLGNGVGGGSTIAAFMPVDAIMGPIDSTVDLGAVWSKGGFLVAICSWTLDGGNGPDDYVCFISDRGQDYYL